MNPLDKHLPKKLPDYPNLGWSAHLDPDQHKDLYVALRWIADQFERVGIGDDTEVDESEECYRIVTEAIKQLTPEGAQCEGGCSLWECGRSMGHAGPCQP